MKVFALDSKLALKLLNLLRLLPTLVVIATHENLVAGLELVRDGKPSGSIIIPAQPLAVESYAAKELQYHIETATGAGLPIVSEGTDMPNGAHIFLGHCIAVSKIPLADLPGNSYVIKTSDADLFIVGKDSRAIR